MMISHRVLAVFLIGLMVVAAAGLVAGEASVQQRSSSNVEQRTEAGSSVLEQQSAEQNVAQNADVSGDNARIEQESMVQVENNTASGGVHLEQNVTWENGSAQVERSVERFGDNLSYTVEQDAGETGSGVTSSQRVTEDGENAEVGQETASANIGPDGAETAAAEEQRRATAESSVGSSVDAVVRTLSAFGDALVSIFSF